MILSDIATRVRTLLNDQTAPYRWLDSEIILWTNDAQKMIVINRPDSCVQNSVVSLVAGTLQSVPSTAIRLLDVVRNMGADGSTPGRAIRIVERDLVDSLDPNWHAAKGALVIKNFMYDERNPRQFFVNPPATSSSMVLVSCSKNPATLTALTDTLEVNDIYLQVIVDYVMFRAYSKDAEFSANAQLASGYLQAAYAMLGIKLKKDVGFSPELNNRGASPSTAAIKEGGV